MADLEAPSERTCRRCGRADRYDSTAGVWRIVDNSGEPFCLHVWDINGSYVP
ncbi:MAG: HEWD family protein [Halobacteriaceae archaeon]